MRCEDAVSILASLDHDSGTAGDTGNLRPAPDDSLKFRRYIPSRAVLAGQVVFECLRNGLPPGAAIRSVASAFDLPREIVAMQFGRVRALRRKTIRR